MYTEKEIICFIKKQSGSNVVHSNSDIFGDIGMVGDDFHEMMEKYSVQFNVDMEKYLWYFHADEEGFGSIGSIFFAPPYKRVKRIPVTPSMMAAFANKGKWEMDYPDHKLPLKRYDLIINGVLVGGFVLAWIAWLIYG